jgi:hypothetical protein
LDPPVHFLITYHGLANPNTKYKLVQKVFTKSAIVSVGGFYKPSIADISLTWSVVVIFAATSVVVQISGG